LSATEFVEESPFEYFFLLQNSMKTHQMRGVGSDATILTIKISISVCVSVTHPLLTRGTLPRGNLYFLGDGRTQKWSFLCCTRKKQTMTRAVAPVPLTSLRFFDMIPSS